MAKNKLTKTGKVRKTYTYKSEQTRIDLIKRAQKNLERYRKAQEIAKRNELYKQYKELYYSTTKQLRKGKVVLSRAGVSKIYSEVDFQAELRAYEGDVSKVVKSNLGLLDRDNAIALQQSLASSGIEITIEQAMVKDLSPEAWAEIKNNYHLYREQYGLTAENASKMVGIDYFGS